MSHTRVGRTLALATAGLLFLTAPTALATQATVSGRLTQLRRLEPGDYRSKPYQLTTTFTLAREQGQSSTLRRAVLRLPSNLAINAGRFATCSAATINARNSFRKCPRGSKLGTGVVLLDVPAAGVLDVPGQVTLFNGPGGRSITIHVYLENPVVTSVAFSARLVKTSGRYGYTLTTTMPAALQQLRGGLPTEIKRLTFSLGAIANGRVYIELKQCPSSGRTAIAGAFDFVSESSPAQALGVVSCR